VGKKIAVLGTGANGAGIGADLARAGLDVLFIEQWPAHVEAMRADGIRVVMPEETVVTPVRAIHLCEVATLREKFDLVFVVLKAYDTRWGCELIKSVLADDGLVVGLQNGMSIDDIAAAVGPERTIGAVIEMASNMFDPGTVVRETPPSASWFTVGAIHPDAAGREAEVTEVLSHAGTVEVSDDIRSSKWMKLVANAAELVPSRQRSQSQQGTLAAPATRVPGGRSGESLSTTRPTISWPGIIGPWCPEWGWRRCSGISFGPATHSVTSVPHRPDRSTSTRTSPVPGTGTGASSRRMSPGPW
jgi:ribulose 1,5-bisphosphate synthetase/thiazole synthase